MPISQKDYDRFEELISNLENDDLRQELIVGFRGILGYD